MPKLIILTKNMNFPGSITRDEKRETFTDLDDSLSERKKELQKDFCFVAEATSTYKPWNGPKEVTHIMICAHKEEDVLNLFFSKAESATYCNDISVSFKEKSMNDKYVEFFFESEQGIDNYARAGGNMM